MDTTFGTRISDADLIRGCRAGNANAWEHIFDQYSRLVFSVPLHYGLSKDEAADIVQLTFTILLESIEIIRDDSNLAAWLCTVARRHTWRALKRGQHEQWEVSHAEFMDEASRLMGQPNNDIEYWELVSWLEAGMKLLKKRCQDLLQALYFDDQTPSYVDLADRLGVSVGSIGPTRARCLEHLKKLLEAG